MNTALKALRFKAGYTKQSQVIEKARGAGLNLSLSSLSHMERGDFKWLPRESTIDALSKLYNVPIKDLMILFQTYLNGQKD